MMNATQLAAFSFLFSNGENGACRAVIHLRILREALQGGDPARCVFVEYAGRIVGAERAGGGGTPNSLPAGHGRDDFKEGKVRLLVFKTTAFGSE
jgi:hypothetical protein